MQHESIIHQINNLSLGFLLHYNVSTQILMNVQMLVHTIAVAMPSVPTHPAASSVRATMAMLEMEPSAVS